MRAGSKHRGIKQFAFSDFTGGVNFALPPEMLNPNEASIIQNFEFDPSNATLKVRDGLQLLATADGDIDTLYYSKNLDVLLFSIGNSLYTCDKSGNVALVGTLAGGKIPVFCEWENKVLIASGGHLQTYDGVTLTTIDSNFTYPSPSCDYVTTMKGRVAVSNTGDDNVYFSGVGDETNWNFAGTDADALQIEIGYKDGGNITALVPYSKDLVAFKDSRNVYRLVGWYPDWIVYKIAGGNSCISRFAAVNFGNHALFVDRDGIKSVDTVQAYGDMKVFDVGAKVNQRLTANLQTADDVRVWHIQNKGQIWVRVKGEPVVYVFHYLIGSWTTFIFPDVVKGATADQQSVFIAIGSKIYRMEQGANDDGQDIQARLVTRKILPAAGDFLVKLIRFHYYNFAQGYAVLKVGNIYKQIEATDKPDTAYSDTDTAYSDSDPLAIQVADKVQFRTNHRVSALQAELITNNAQVGISGIILNAVEV